MDVKEIKCPSCGANLTYNSKKHRYECEYCKTTFIDQKDDNTPDPRVELTPDDLKIVKKHVTSQSNNIFVKVFLSLFIVTFVIGIVIFFIAFMNVFSSFM